MPAGRYSDVDRSRCQPSGLRQGPAYFGSAPTREGEVPERSQSAGSAHHFGEGGSRPDTGGGGGRSRGCAGRAGGHQKGQAGNSRGSGRSRSGGEAREGRESREEGEKVALGRGSGSARQAGPFGTEARS